MLLQSSNIYIYMYMYVCVCVYMYGYVHVCTQRKEPGCVPKERARVSCKMPLLVDLAWFFEACPPRRARDGKLPTLDQHFGANQRDISASYGTSCLASWGIPDHTVPHNWSRDFRDFNQYIPTDPGVSGSSTTLTRRCPSNILIGL